MRLVAGLVIGSFLGGCARSIVYNPTLLPRFENSIPSRVVLADLTTDKNVVPDNFKPFVGATERSLRQEMEQSGLVADLKLERDMSSAGFRAASGKVILLRYRLVDMKEATNFNGVLYVAMRMSCLAIIPCFFVGLPHYTDDKIDLVVELKAYEVSNGKVAKIKDTTTEEYLNVYDTSDSPPIDKVRYELSVLGGLGNGNVSGDEQVAFSREMAADLARQLVARSAEDIRRIVGNEPNVSR